MKRYILAFGALLATFAFASKGAAQTLLTLNDCLERAKTNNAAMRSAANDLLSAEQTVRSARTRFFPTLSATGGGVMVNNALVSVDINGLGTMSMGENGLFGGVSATLPLFTGGQIVNANKLADLNKDVAQLQRAMTQDEVMLNTETYFWVIVQLEAKQKTVRSTIDLLRQLERDVDAAVEAGVRMRNDLLQVQLRQGEMESNRLEIDNGISLYKDLLAQYIGMTGAEINLSYSTDDLAEPAKYFAEPASALPSTNEYALLEAQVRQAQLQKRLTLGKLLPSVAIGGGYTYEDLFGSDHKFWVGFATISIPISDWWSGSHDLKKDKANLDNARIALTDNSELLMIRMTKAWQDLIVAYEQIGIAQASVEQATENLRLQKDSYDSGTITMSDLLEAQMLYTQSHDHLSTARTTYAIRLREYLISTAQN